MFFFKQTIYIEIKPMKSTSEYFNSVAMIMLSEFPQTSELYCQLLLVLSLPQF